MISCTDGVYCLNWRHSMVIRRGSLLEGFLLERRWFNLQVSWIICILIVLLFALQFWRVCPWIWCVCLGGKIVSVDIFIYDSMISWKEVNAALRGYLVVDNVSFLQCFFFLHGHEWINVQCWKWLTNMRVSVCLTCFKNVKKNIS